MFGLIVCGLGCGPRERAPVVETKQTPILVVPLGGSKQQHQATFRWEIRNAGRIGVRFGGQTLELAHTGGPATITLALHPGPTPAQVTGDLSATSVGSSSSTSVNVGTQEKDLSQLVDPMPRQLQMPANGEIALAKGKGAFPSLVLRASP